MARNLGMFPFKTVNVQIFIFLFFQEVKETLAVQELLSVLSHFVK